jgi:hypothetical protein
MASAIRDARTALRIAERGQRRMELAAKIGVKIAREL